MLVSNTHILLVKVIITIYYLQLGIEAMSGGVAKGDIAIDDVKYSQLSCSASHPTTTTGKFTCDFEDPKLCG